MANSTVSFARAKGSIRLQSETGAVFELLRSINNLLLIKQLREQGIVMQCDAVGYHLQWKQIGQLLARDMERPNTRLIWLQLSALPPPPANFVWVCGAAMVQTKV